MNSELIESAWEELAEVISIYSPSGSEQEVAKSLLEWFEGYGIQSWIDEVGNIRATAGSGPVQVMLAGHIDTVSPMLNFRRENDTIYGRGTVDAKSPLMCFAANVILAANSDTHTIHFAGLVGEEKDSRGARALAQEEFNLNHLIIGEPSNTTGITLAYKGRVLIRATYDGDYGHSGYPLAFPSERMVSDWQNLLLEFDNQANEVGVKHDSARLVQIEGIEGRPCGIRATIDIRIAMDSSVEQVLQSVQEIFTDCEYEIIDSCQPCSTQPNAPIVQAMKIAIRQNGQRPRLFQKTGTADLNILSEAFAIDGIAYGPGDSSLDHTEFEHITKNDFVSSIAILQSALSALTL